MEAEYSAIKEYFGTDYIGALRHYRDILLKESDWTQLPDAQLSTEKVAEWKTYRQALRDLPANTTDWKKVEYPTQPS